MPRIVPGPGVPREGNSSGGQFLLGLLAFVALCLTIMIGIGIFLHRHKNDVEPPCEAYRNDRVINIPARCLRHYNGTVK